MMNADKLFQMADSFRGSMQMDEGRNLLIGLMAVRWHLDEKRAAEMLRSEDFILALKKAIEEIEKKDRGLDGALSELVLDKLEGKEDLLNEAKGMLEEIENSVNLTKEALRDMANCMIFEMETGEGMNSTPETIREIFAGLINPYDGCSVADYFSGVGSTICGIHKKWGTKNIRYYGEELDRKAYLLSLIAVRLNGIDNCRIENKDVHMIENEAAGSFDYIFMDAPFSMRSNLESGIFKYGMPSKNSVDWGNYQIALSALREGGKAVATAPLGALFRMSDRDIRKAIVNDDKIEAVVQLPPSLYSETAIPTALIVFSSDKNEENKNKIVFVDASKDYSRKNRRQNELSVETIEKIIDSINNGLEIKGFSVVVDSGVVAKHDYNLNSNVYINSKIISSRLGRTKELREIAEVLPGVQISGRDMEALKRNPTHYFLNIKNIQDDGIVYNEDERIRDKKFDWRGKYDIMPGDIILTTKGTTTRMLVVPDEFRESFISSNLTVIRVNKAKYDPYLLKKFLESDTGKLVLENITTGTTIKLINASRLEKIRVPDYGQEKVFELGRRIRENEERLRAALSKAKASYEEEDARICEKLGLA